LGLEINPTEYCMEDPHSSGKRNENVVGLNALIFYFKRGRKGKEEKRGFLFNYFISGGQQLGH